MMHFPSERTVLSPMKKLLFTLTLLAALLCASAAMAAGRPCDKCGGSTVLSGSGSWCHWYCETCDYTTSRSHDPHNSASGLSPDSCTGSCRWCGAAANYSSHSFTKFVSNNNATCTKDCTETAKCDNGSCSQTKTRDIAGTALGHDYAVAEDVAPTCTTAGRNKLTCRRCNHVTYENVNQLGHFYGQWAYNGNKTHSARCRRDCGHSQTVDCSIAEYTLGSTRVILCPVCGFSETEGGEADMKPSSSVTYKAEDGSKITGRLTVLIDAAPLAVDVGAEAFYVINTTLQSGGTQLEPTTLIDITINLNDHPFKFETGKYADKRIGELTTADANLVRLVKEEQEDGTIVERWRSIPFTLEGGKLNFGTRVMGTFILATRTAKDPNAPAE